MNRLWGSREIKSQPTSSRETRQIATSGSASPASLRSRAPALLRSRTTSEVALEARTAITSPRQSSTPQPISQAEQYWAARALTAETLLAARTTHNNEVRGILAYAEHKRARDISDITREHNVRRAQLERIIFVLVLLSLAFALFVVYILAHSQRQHAKKNSSWSVSLPNHFTIPILSPFTSVVETETAVIGAWSIAVLVVVAGAVIYGVVRHWLNSRSSRT